jgi:hypothetical protein
MEMKASFQPDIVIENAEGQPIAVVEVQSRRNLSRDVATEIRRNLLSYGLPTQIPYFLLLSQDMGYLWKGSTQTDPNIAPSYEFPMNDVVARYSKRDPGQRLYETELSLLALQWLTNLSAKPQDATKEPEKTLVSAGFYDSIRDSMVLIEEAI